MRRASILPRVPQRLPDQWEAALVSVLERRPKFDQSSRTLRRLRRESLVKPRHEPGETTIDGYSVRYLDLLSLYMEYKDIWHHGIYHFDSTEPAPRVLDGGGYIGMSLLYTKHVHPGARITCFEPDPQIHKLLTRNVQANGLRDVELVMAGLAAERGSASFVPDGADGGRIVEAEGEESVSTVPLSSYLDERVDFLKLNIEGFELPVLEEAGDSLRNVREIVIEYHGWPDSPQRLGPLLSLLDAQGFRYLVNHFDYATNGAVRPPFTLARDTRWFALVYAKRQDLL
jgi:FkbM family methyltransferase